MAEYIEREEAVAVIYGQHIGGKEACENARPNTFGADLREIVADIEDIPAADAQPVRHGRWINRGWSTVCSECGEDYAFAKRNYCPNCGAKMDQSEENFENVEL